MAKGGLLVAAICCATAVLPAGAAAKSAVPVKIVPKLYYYERNDSLRANLYYPQMTALAPEGEKMARTFNGVVFETYGLCNYLATGIELPAATGAQTLELVVQTMMHRALRTGNPYCYDTHWQVFQYHRIISLQFRHALSIDGQNADITLFLNFDMETGEFLADDYTALDSTRLVATAQQICREEYDIVRKTEQRLTAEDKAGRPELPVNIGFIGWGIHFRAFRLFPYVPLDANVTIPYALAERKGIFNPGFSEKDGQYPKLRIPKSQVPTRKEDMVIYY